MTRAPLRFLLTVLVLWAGVRAAILLPGSPGAIAPVAMAEATSPPAVAFASSAREPETEADTPPPVTASPDLRTTVQRQAGRMPGLLPAANPTFPIPPSAQAPKLAPGPVAPPALSAGPPAFPSHPSTSRWSVSAWLLVRDEGGAGALAPGGTLGGSQAGARLSHALGGSLSLSVRAYLPLHHRAGAELAAGIDWRPHPAVPVHLLAERRQRLGRDGRSAFGLTVYGGASRTLGAHLRLDAYAQAGVVGLRARDLFADGALRLSRRVGPVEIGAGAWGAAQPGARRLDAGPSLSWRLPVRAANLRLQADWRFRLAGGAAPGSGPALTLAADF